MSSEPEHPEVYKVIGAPGTGKTTRVVGNPELELDGLFIENGEEYSMDEQMLVTYTNAGVDEAKERLSKMVDVPKYKLDDRITTIHSACYGLLNDHPHYDGLEWEQIVDHWDKKNFCDKYGLEFGWDDDEDDLMGGDKSAGNTLFDIYSWLKSNRKELEEWKDCPAPWEFSEDPLFLMQEWEAYKGENGYIGFTDMIEDVVELAADQLVNLGWGPLFPDEDTTTKEVFEQARWDPERNPEVIRGKGAFVDTEVLYVDEVQDLTPLQWEWYLAQKLVCEKVYIGGDDDQTIYGWAGANPEFMLDEEGDFEVLETTYRIPKEIWERCDESIQQVEKRQDKEVEPNGEGGEFISIYSPSTRQIVEHIEEGEVMILFRARYQIDDFCQKLQEYGIPYRNMSTFDMWDDDLVKVRDAFDKIENKGEEINGDELQVLMEKAPDNIIKKDNGVTEEEKVMGMFGGVDPGRIDDVFSCTDYTGEFSMNTYLNECQEDGDLNYYECQAIKGCVREENGDMDPDRVRIGTIHSAKGKEAETVVLATDSTQAILESMAEETGVPGSGIEPGSPISDSERRVYYVGMSRASQKLVLAQGVLDPETSIDISCILDDVEDEHKRGEWDSQRRLDGASF